MTTHDGQGEGIGERRSAAWARRGRPGPARRRAARVLAAVGLVVLGAVVGSTTAVALHTFTDVPDTHPFHEDVGWLAEHGIADGYGDGTFRPGDPLSRQAAAAMLRRLAGGDPSVDPVVTAGSLDVQVFSAPNATITAASSATAQTVLSVDLDQPGRYLLVTSAQLQTTHERAIIECEPKGTGVVHAASLRADLIAPQYREAVSTVFFVEELGGPLEIACHRHTVVGSGAADVAAPWVAAIRVGEG